MPRWLGLVAVWLGMISAGAVAQNVTPVPSLDASKFLGTWFEIARLPNKQEKKCVGDALMIYATDYKAGRFQVVDSCKRPDGTQNVRNQSGRRADRSGDGKLKIQTIWPFSAKYWVVGLGPDYDWALLATPNRKKLWVLSKTAVLPAGQWAAAEAVATAQGFDTGKLARVSQAP